MPNFLKDSPLSRNLTEKEIDNLLLALQHIQMTIEGYTSTDIDIIKETPNALRLVFAASPIIAIQLIGAAYFQAAGKAVPALLLTLTKQGFFLIPLILILPNFYGIFGVWIAFPIADVLATVVTGFFLRREIKRKLTHTQNGI